MFAPTSFVSEVQCAASLKNVIKTTVIDQVNDAGVTEGSVATVLIHNAFYSSEIFRVLKFHTHVKPLIISKHIVSDNVALRNLRVLIRRIYCTV